MAVSTQPNSNNSKRLLRLKAVEQKIGFKSAWIYQSMAEGNFPKPLKVGSRSVAWLESDIDQWIDARIAESEIK